MRDAKNKSCNIWPLKKIAKHFCEILEILDVLLVLQFCIQIIIKKCNTPMSFLWAVQLAFTDRNIFKNITFIIEMSSHHSWCPWQSIQKLKSKSLLLSCYCPITALFFCFGFRLKLVLNKIHQGKYTPQKWPKLSIKDSRLSWHWSHLING